MILPFLLFSMAQPMLSVAALERDPFYLTRVPQNQESRYDISAPKVVGIVSMENSVGALIRFDDKTEVVFVGDVVKEHIVMTICENGVVVADKDKKEKRWLM